MIGLSSWTRRTAGISALLVTGFVAGLPGCGTPGAPQPPSLNLPDRVQDLSATRAGNQVALSWTMPRRNTDKLPLKANVTARICRDEGSAQGSAPGAAPCVAVATQPFSPASPASYVDSLPAALSSGSP